ncbi:contactin-associated protein like 5-3-like [Glandiceps talaboti]
MDTVHWLRDTGYLTDSIPVTQIRFGDTGGVKMANITLGDLKCYHQTSSEVHKTCYHIKNDGVTTDGEYFIDPDGTSSGVDPFLVTCDLSHNETHAKQSFSHDSEARTYVSGFDPAGSYAKDVNYDVSWDQFDAYFSLDNVQECEQYIKYECYGAKLLDSGTGWWISRGGETMRYWGGGSPDQLSCSCGVDSSCAGGSSDLCNCDAASSSWATDDGYLYNNTHLPVSQIRLGDTQSGEGYFTLGKLVCYITTGKYAIYIKRIKVLPASFESSLHTIDTEIFYGNPVTMVTQHTFASSAT